MYRMYEYCRRRHSPSTKIPSENSTRQEEELDEREKEKGFVHNYLR
jgi:hypothetical protein